MYTDNKIHEQALKFVQIGKKYSCQSHEKETGLYIVL